MFLLLIKVYFMLTYSVILQKYEYCTVRQGVVSFDKFKEAK